MFFTTSGSARGKRLDHYLQQHLPQHSRARIQAWIKNSRVLVNGAHAKASLVLRGGENIQVDPADPPPLKASAEDLPLEILYQDDSVIAVNKPAGLTVHAGAGAHSGTLVNRLVHHFQTLSKLGGELRPGIVHRIDKGTSGVLLVARNDAAHRALAGQFADRTTEKIYIALVQGVLKQDAGTITKPIARDPAHRTRMTARRNRGRDAITHFRVLKRFDASTLLEIRIGTGRTHQIRAHMASIHHPVVGDRLYGARAAERIFLHAWKITFTSPSAGERVTVEAPLPAEFASLQ